MSNAAVVSSRHLAPGRWAKVVKPEKDRSGVPAYAAHGSCEASALCPACAEINGRRGSRPVKRAIGSMLKDVSGMD